MASRLIPFRQLLACLRGEPDSNTDWEAVFALANRTLVTAAVSVALRHTQDLPDDVKSFLHEIEARSRQRNDMLRAQLEEVLVLLNGIGIRPVLLKGTAFLASEDDEASCRILSDIDLLLPEDRMDQAVASLREAGFSYQGEKPNAWNVHALGREQDPGLVDLHTRLKVARPLLDHSRLASNARDSLIGHGHALIPSPEDQALVFILHDQVQEYDYAKGAIDLRHLVDLAMLDRLYKPGWRCLPTMVDGRYAHNAVRVQLCCLRDLLGVDIGRLGGAGIWHRLQYRRRLLQLRFPAIAPLMTLLTLLCDPPINPRMRGGAKDDRWGQRKRFWRIRRFLELNRSKYLSTKA